MVFLLLHPKMRIKRNIMQCNTQARGSVEHIECAAVLPGSSHNYSSRVEYHSSSYISVHRCSQDVHPLFPSMTAAACVLVQHNGRWVCVLVWGSMCMFLLCSIIDNIPSLYIYYLWFNLSLCTLPYLGYSMMIDWLQVKACLADKLVSGSSLGCKALLRSHKTLNSKTKALQHKILNSTVAK